jgi:signal transduction histidine kinase
MGILKLKRMNVNLTQLFNGILESVRPQASSRGQQLTEEIDSSLPEAFVDSGRLRQVTLNILNNALKFTPSGGSIIFKAKLQGNNLLVEVKDTGPGIANQDQTLLFQTYYHSDRSNLHFSGLGLGLAISKTLVELHGGRIWAESDEGKGSAFFFSIPLVPAVRGEFNDENINH